MPTHIARDTQAITSTVICGHVFCPIAHGGNLFELTRRGGRDFVALKMVNVALSIERTMSEQEKLTPRRKNFAMRTRVLILYLLSVEPIW